MWHRAEPVVLAMALLLAACSGESSQIETSIAPGPGAESATAAVNGLVTALDEPDFFAASRLAVPGQAALAALAEGATFGDVAGALREGDEEVAANFWSGFAQGSGAFLSQDVTITETGTLSEGDIEFHTITVQSAEGSPRTILVRDGDGYRIDLFASFGSGLADKMITPVERLLAAQTEDSRLILVELQDIVPSLMVAARMPGTTGEISQQILALIEVITRVS